jgi:hypothetical protein
VDRPSPRGESVSLDPSSVIRDALSRALVDEDGETVTLRLLPPLSEPELAAFRETLPSALPPAIERLLRFCRGVEGISAADTIDFTGRTIDFEFTEAFPHGLPIAADGWGNFWVVDLSPSSTDWGPVYFACHDAPIVLLQSPNLAEFLVEVFRMDTPPHTSLVDDVHEDRLFRVWRDQPGIIPQPAAAASPDPTLRGFAARLSASHVIVDLRGATPGQGFAWGRYRSGSLKRHGVEPIFALEKKRGILARLLHPGR